MKNETEIHLLLDTSVLTMLRRAGRSRELHT
jgi:hypothetical protein